MKKTGLLLLLLLVCLAAGAQRQTAYAGWPDSLARLTGLAPAGGNSVSYTHSGTVFLDGLVKDIRAARESVSMEFYWFDTDSSGRMVRDLLADKAREGVQVRLIIDNLVTPLAPEFFYEKIRKAGGEVLYASDFRKMSLPASLSRVIRERDHRKILVVDHRIAYTGGMNICDPAIFEWDDLEMRIEGPAAASMEKLFARSWEKMGGGSVPVPEADAEGPVVIQMIPGDADGIVADIYAQAVRKARDYLYIRTPYFIPPDDLQEALLEAARRGVDVRMLLAKSDHSFVDEAAKDYYAPLLEAGVRISVREDKFDHSKAFVADDEIVCCGTLNWDNRSFFINLENNIFLFDEAFAREMAEDFLRTEASARQKTASDGEARGLRRLYRGFLRWFTPLL